MKKLFAMFLALTMTFQLITPAWADAAVEEPEEITEASEVVEEEPQEETTEAAEEALPEETTEATEEQTEATEPTLEELPEEEEPVMEEVPEEELALQSSQSIKASGTCGANLKWELTEDGTITISGYGDMENYSSKGTPWPSQSLKTLYVTAGVTSIGERAFFGTSLESVHFGSASLTLGNDCFSSCAHLTEIDFGTGTIKPGNNSFSLCDALTSVNIPSNVEMDEASYYGPGSGHQMFYNCAALKSATVDCAFVGPYVFESCYALQDVTFTNPDTGIYFVRDESSRPSGHPFNSNGNRRTNVTVYGYECSEAHALVQKTQGKAYSNMTFVQLPGDSTSHTEEILPAVESTCETTGLTEGRRCAKCHLIFQAQEQTEKKEHLVVPVEAKEAGCTEPGHTAYWTCNGCGKVYTDAEGTMETTLAQLETAPIGHNMTKTEAVAPTHTAPGNNEYYTCTRCGKVFKDADGKMETTVEAETLEQLPGIASGTCGKDLTWVVYEDGKLVISGTGEMDDYGEVNSSGGCSYYPHKPWSDYNVTSLLFSDGITKIGAFAFYECKNLTGKLEIPNTVTAIGDAAFCGTSFQGELKLPNGLTEIAAWTFKNCDGFTGQLKIPEGVTRIGNNAFYNCRNLIGKLVLPDGLSSVESSAFSGCIGFNGQLNLPGSLTEIGDNAFSDCSGFRGELIIPETLTSIGSSAFSGCSGFSGFSLPENMTAIPAGMFSGWKGLTGVLTIPEYITGIGDSAFSSCSGLTEVHFSANLESIGGSAFYYCTGLAGELSFPHGLKTIGNSAFYGCTSLTGSIIIPDSVTSIGTNAFYAYDRHSLSGKLVLPKGIHFADSSAFEGCYGLKALYIPVEVIQIRADAFKKCNFTDVFYAGTSTQWQNVDIRSGNDILSTATMHFVESSGTTGAAISWQYGSDGVLTITGTGAIPDYTQESPAPWQGTRPVSVVIGDGITGIGNNAFADCETLRYIYFGGTKEVWSALPVGEGNEILSSAAVHCGPELRCVPDLVEAKWSTCAEYGNYAYYLCPVCGRAYKDEDARQETTVEEQTRKDLASHDLQFVWAVSPSHTAPGHNSYYICKKCGNAFKDQEGKIPTTIEAETLPQLPGIASGNCGDSVTWVLYEDGLLEISGTGDMWNDRSNDWSNYGDKIKTVNIQDGVTSVGDWAFGGDNRYTKLESVHLPDSIQRIGKNAFYRCTGLKGELVLPANLKRIEDGAFAYCSGITGTLNLPENLEYLSGFNGCTGFSGTLTIPESVTEIGNSAFSGCTGLDGTLTFLEGLTSIGDYAFSGCKGFTGALTFPEGLTSIGDSAFSGCTGFAGALTFLEGLTTIGEYAFSGCTGLIGKLTFPTTLVKIGGAAFRGCDGFSGALKLPDSLTEIGSSAFFGCKGLTSIVWPAGITKIPAYVCWQCTGLQGMLELPNSVTEIETMAFSECTSVTGLKLPQNLKKIGESAFKDSYNIAGELKIPDGVTEIGAQAFYDLKISGNLIIPNSVRTIGEKAFFGWHNNLESLTFPEGIQIINEWTFQYCYNIKKLVVPQSVLQIREGAFCDVGVTDIYYGGTLEQWMNINIRARNDNLSTATLHYIQSSGTCGDTLTWKIDSDDVLTVSGAGAMPDYTADNPAPWSDASFTGLVVEEGVTHIGAYAFYGHDTLAGPPSLPATLETVGESAFHGCAPDYFRYNGTPEGWAKVTIGEDNEALQTVHYLEHTLSLVEAVPATCTQPGNNAYYLCDVCHQAFLDQQAEQPTTAEDQILPALSHNTVHVDTKAAACTETGMEAHYVCENCGKLFRDYYAAQEVTAEELTIPALGHTMQETQARAATCTETGNNTYYTCITCGIVFQDDQGEHQTTVDAETIPALGHTMVKTEAVAATCTESGTNAYYTCTVCGKSYKDAEGSQKTTSGAEYLPAMGHSMKRIDTQAPTCTEDGNRAYYVCDTCHRAFRNASGSEATTAEAEALPALGHRMTETPAKAATCTTSGNNAYFTCATCHKIYKDADGRQETTKEAEVLPALGHTMTETAAKEATCTESGNNAYFTCETCHLVFKDAEGKQKTTVAAETLKALGHKMTKTAAKAATCTEDGNNVYFTCATCHKVYKDQQGTQETTVQAETLKALGHSMTATPAKAATCTESGNNAYFTCGTCHKVYKDRLGTQETTVKEETLPALGHTMAKTEAKEPTCTEDGTNAYYTCATCHQVFKDELGQRRTTVSAEKLSAFGHTMKQTAPKEATCTESGNHLYYTCITCGIVFQDEEGEKQTTVDAETIPALGHTMEETPAVAPTCTEGGNNAYFTCDTCHKVYQDAEGKQETTVKAETLAPLGHTMVKTDALAPTCTESGTNAYYTCDTCHKVYKDADGKQETDVEAEILAPTGHKMEAVEAKDPTCTEPGNHAYYLCANCDKAYLDEQGEKETTVTAETIPALGHTMEETPAIAPTCTEGNNAYYTCATCHKVYQDAEGKQETTVEAETLAPLGHSMVETPAVEPTHTSGGNNAYYTCSVCHKVFKDVDGKTETTVEAEQLPRLPGLAHGTSGGLTWFLSEEEVLTVSGNGRMPDYSGNDLAPWYGFRGKIQKVVLEEGVQTVGSYAFFDCNMLTEVELPQSVTKLGKSCFDGCGQLKLLSLDKVPGELTQKVTDLNGLATLAEPIQTLVGNRAAYHWRLETIRGEDQVSNLAKLDGTQLEVIHSGKFYLVCEEDYTGLSAAIEVGTKTSTEIRPDTEQLTGGESLILTAWAMPFDTELSANWTLTKESEAYASITTDGTLTAKAVSAPVQITVKAEPVNGEEAAEKTLWILPKTTGLGILADGHLTGETLTVDLTETRELTLSAQIQPQGAGTKVTWTSSQMDIATVDPDGNVLLLKPGKTVIRAETQDGSGIATELTLTVRYLDSAEELTLTAQIPETGLEPGMTAKLTLSGENAIDPEKVEFYIPASQSAIATVDETGLLTAGTTPGTVTVTAALKDDPLMRKAQLTLTVNPMLNHALRLESSIPDGLGYVDGNMFYGEIAGIAGQNRSFALKVQGQDYLGNWAEAKNVTYASSNPAIAAVDASGTVSLTAKEEGTCLITVRCTDALEAEAQLTVVLQNSAPRLGANTVTLNSNSTRGATVDLVASYGNTVDTVTVYDYNKSTKTYALSTMFTAEAEDGTLTLYSQGVLKNGTYPVKLEVACRTGVYTFTMNVKVANATPKVTVKQTAKLNLFYKDSTAPLTVTAPGQTVTDVELTDTGDFTLMSNGEDWEIVYISENAKPDTKGTLNVYLEGYQAPVQVNLTVGTVTTAPAIKLSATSSTLNTALNSDLTTKVTLLDKSGQPLELENPTVDCSSADVSVKGSLLTITLDAPKSATVTMELQDSTWAQSVKLTHKVAVSEKLPTLKPAGTLTLNSLFAKGTAETGMILSQGNLTLVNVEATPAAKEGTPALAESEKLRITYDPETGHMVASIKDAPKAGTYSFNCTGTLEDGTQIPGGTLRVTVSATAPKVKLSAASVKLNKFLAGAEQGSVTVTVPTGYQVVDFTGKSDSMTYDADTGILTVALEDASDNGGNYTLYPVVRDVETGEEVELPTKLSFKVQTYNSQKLSVSLSAKGKLDTQTDSEILYTVTKLTGCLGTVDNVILEGQDKDLFRADMDVVNGKTTVHLTLVDGVTYATNKAYKVQFRFYACGTEILSPVQTVKVTQTALKVTAPKNITYYQAQKSPLRVVLTTNVPLDEVVLNDKTAKEFRAAVGEVTLNGNRVEFEITNPAALTAGKSYSVALDATPENNAENAKPVAVRLTVKVQK